MVRRLPIHMLVTLFLGSLFLSIWITGILIPPYNVPLQGEKSPVHEDPYHFTIEVPIYRTKSQIIQTLPLEEYLIGVVAAEMPHEFELEALKAQAIAARTYLIRKIVEEDLGDVPVGAWVNDDKQHQAYLDDVQLKEKWGSDYSKNRKKIEQAVYSTEGLVITYGGRPIHATFFSTSNGYTENAEEYWSESYPYLKSVASPWDKESPYYQNTVAIPIGTFENRLGVKIPHPQNNKSFSKVLQKTTGNQIAKIQIGDHSFTGREVREKLELNSATFTWEIDDDQILITTYGYGHGVGMSQYGANGMAKEGKKAEEIIQYYYQGVELEDYRKWIRR